MITSNSLETCDIPRGNSESASSVGHLVQSLMWINITERSGMSGFAFTLYHSVSSKVYLVLRTSYNHVIVERNYGKFFLAVRNLELSNFLI